jgi:hypothetical protein
MSDDVYRQARDAVKKELDALILERRRLEIAVSGENRKIKDLEALIKALTKVIGDE